MVEKRLTGEKKSSVCGRIKTTCQSKTKTTYGGFINEKRKHRHKKFSTPKMELQVPYSICAEISQEGVFRRKTPRNKRDIEVAMSMEGSRNSRRGSMSRPYTYAGEYPAQNERFGVHGVFERQECIVNISEMGEYEICIPKPRILVQGILRGYRGQEHKGNKKLYSRTIKKGSGK